MIFGIQLVQQQLRTRFPGIPVTSRVPADRPRRFIRVEQAGPTYPNQRCITTLVIVQVYGETAQATAETALEVLQALADMPADLPPVFDWGNVNGPYSHPDPDIPKVHRWQITGVITHDSQM